MSRARVSAALARDVSHHVAQLSASAVAAHGSFVIALSGGSLPSFLLPLLDDPSVAWDRWTVFFVDERLVPAGHPDSNRAACAALLARVPAERVEGVRDELSPEEAARDYAARLEKVGRPIDLAMLGMGEDGHTASLFPGHALLDEKVRLVASIVDSPKPPPTRVTMTLPTIVAARNIVFVAAGTGKQDALAAIFGEKRPGIPAGMVLHQRPDTVFFTDAAAAAKL